MTRDKNRNKFQKKRQYKTNNQKQLADPQQPSRSGALWLFGKHAVLAALKNPMRNIKRLIVNGKNREQYKQALSEIHLNHTALNPEIVSTDHFNNYLPADSVHQGIALLTSPLPNASLDESCAVLEGQRNLVIILDQVTDPHNVGAIIRSAAAFGAKAIITTDRHAPPESGALAKAASGALETLPWIRVTNLSRAMDQIAELGYWRVGLDGHTDMDIGKINLGQNIAVVMGAEGKGLRKGTADHCDALVKLPISEAVESLNVSNAAAIALYVFSAQN